jgi:hypothetical protein
VAVVIDLLWVYMDSLSDAQWLGFMLMFGIGLYCLGMGVLTRGLK